MIRNLHRGQITLRYAGNQIGPARNSQIVTADSDDYRIMGEQLHQQIRTHFTDREEDQGDRTAPAQRHIEQGAYGFPVALAPVLSAQNRPGRRRRHQEHILDKLNLRRKGNRRHLILGNSSKHQRIPGSHRRQHQALKRDGCGQLPQFAVKSTIIDLHGFLRSSFLSDVQTFSLRPHYHGNRLPCQCLLQPSCVTRLRTMHPSRSQKPAGNLFALAGILTDPFVRLPFPTGLRYNNVQNDNRKEGRP